MLNSKDESLNDCMRVGCLVIACSPIVMTLRNESLGFLFVLFYLPREKYFIICDLNTIMCFPAL
uniref:Uncharacterized protein n=1 Tax=Rhizophora mucronata TaxID=61149 RepID=A0A2P2LEP9_RHIMU